MLLTDGLAPSLSRRVLVTSGPSATSCPTVPGLRERWARASFTARTATATKSATSALGVLGWSPVFVQYAHVVRQWSDDVVYFDMSGALTATERDMLVARAVVIVDGAVTRIAVEDDRLCGVEVDGDRVVARDAVFVAPRFVPNNDVLVALGCRHDDAGWVVVDDGARRRPRCLGRGNVANPRAQVITAAGEGSAAAIAINADLVDEDVRRAQGVLDRVASAEPAGRTAFRG